MKKLILFDFDGVIVDSFKTAFRVTQQLKLGISQKQYRDMFLGNIYDSTDDHQKKTGRKVTQAEWFEYYAPMLLELPLIVGVKEALEKLSQKYTLVVVSSSIDSPIHAYLELHDVHHFFDEVLGADVHRSKVEKIQMIFDKYNIKPSDCVFITDTVGDLLEAEKKGVESLVVTWGFHPKSYFQKTPPAGFIERPGDMLTAVEAYFASRD